MQVVRKKKKKQQYVTGHRKQLVEDEVEVCQLEMRPVRTVVGTVETSGAPPSDAFGNSAPYTEDAHARYRFEKAGGLKACQSAS